MPSSAGSRAVPVAGSRGKALHCAGLVSIENIENSLTKLAGEQLLPPPVQSPLSPLPHSLPGHPLQWRGKWCSPAAPPRPRRPAEPDKPIYFGHPVTLKALGYSAQ